MTAMESFYASPSKSSSSERESSTCRKKKGDVIDPPAERCPFANTAAMIESRLEEDNSSSTLEQSREGVIPSANSFSWRSDPSKSFSDWTIEVCSKSKDGTVTKQRYYCHSNVIAWGPRKSDYFVNLFEQRMNKKPASNISQLELPMVEAKVFPCLLDFLYCETTLSLTADIVCGLYMMAERFNITTLTTAIQEFVEKGLNLEQSIEFLAIARKLQGRDKIEKLVLCANSKLCGYLVKYPTEGSKVTPDLLAHALNRRAQALKVLKGEDPRKYSGDWELERSNLLSVVVAECCHNAIFGDDDDDDNNDSSALTRRTFDRLVHAKHLPAVDTGAAMKILQVETALQNRDDDESLQPKDGSLPKRTLSSIEERCVRALKRDWRETMSMDRNEILGNLSQLNPVVLSSLMVEVSTQYEHDLEAEVAKSKKAEKKRSHKIQKDARRQSKGTKSKDRHGKPDPKSAVSFSPHVETEEIEVDYETLQSSLTPPDHAGWCNAGEVVSIVRHHYDDPFDDGGSYDKYRRP